MDSRSIYVAVLLLGTAVGATALASEPSKPGCNQTLAAHKAESEGGPGYQPAPGQGVRRAESESPAATTLALAAHKTESEGGPGYQPAPGQGVRRAEAMAPCD